MRRFFGGVGFLALTAGLGNASTLTYYVDVFGLGTATETVLTTAQLAAPGTHVVLSIPKLNQSSDPNPGHIFVLTAVNLALNYSSLGNIAIDNKFTAPITYTTAFTQADLTLTAGGTQVVAQTKASTGPGTAACCDINVGSFHYAETLINGLAGSGSNNQNAANLAAFEGFGAGNFSADVLAGPLSATGSSSDPNAANNNLTFGGSGQSGAIMVVTYTFSESAVPEPVTTSLVGGALIGLAALARSRRAKRS